MAPGLPRHRPGDRAKERKSPERVRFGWNRFVRSPPSWSAKADHPRFVFGSSALKTRGWSAFADHDGEAAEVTALLSETGGLSNRRANRLVATVRAVETSRNMPQITKLALMGLVPGSREAGRERCLWPWTPAQGRGDSGRRRQSRPSARSRLPRRHARTCSGHPRLAASRHERGPARRRRDVDARNKSGHDGRRVAVGGGRPSAFPSLLFFLRSPPL